MRIEEKNKKHVVLEGKLKKVSGRYFGFYLPKELEKQYGRARLQIILKLKRKRRRKTKKRKRKR